MTRKDYILIAAALKASRITPPNAWTSNQHATTAREIAYRLAADNAAFDRARFLTACGVAS